MPSPVRHSLVVVAHPDDETLFFGGLLLSHPRTRWKVICVTDAGADGKTDQRLEEFKKALRTLGVCESEEWHFPDQYEKRLDFNAIAEKLKALPRPRAVYTHGAFGEYGHPHHQDISRAVHDAFEKRAPVWSPAYNAYPEKVIRLRRPVYEKKMKLLTEIYGNETKRFLHLLPATWMEGWVKARAGEVRALHDALRGASPFPDLKTLRTYRGIAPTAEKVGYGKLPRPF